MFTRRLIKMKYQYILSIILIASTPNMPHFLQTWLTLSFMEWQVTSEHKAKSNDRSTTVILLSVVITYIICSIPNTVLTLIRLTPHGDYLILTLYGSITFYLAILLLNINSAVNVLLFCFFGKKFRHVFTRVFIKCSWGKRSRKAYHAVSNTAHSQILDNSTKEDAPQNDLEMCH